MACPKFVLFSAAGALLASLAVAMPAFAQDTKHVHWHDNGTVDLILDPEYGGTITATRDDLGALFGPGQKPFDGTTITVLTLDSGPKGGISGLLHAFRPVWEEL